ncbi:hypothetical protein Bca4012_058636 [Brassica carinata]
MKEVRPLTPVKAEEDDTRIMSGADKTELTPALEASSSSLLDAKHANQLTLVAGSEDDRKLVMQTQLGETMVDVPLMVSNEDTKEKTSSPPMMKRRTRCKQNPGYGSGSAYKRRYVIRTVAPTVSENATSSAATENEKTPIWFTLLALQDQDTDAPLPQIPNHYLRVKDGKLPVSYIQKYLATKLNLERENEVELYLRSLPLDPSMLLSDLLGNWIATASPETITTRMGASGADYMMVLSYGRKPQTKSP